MVGDRLRMHSRTIDQPDRSGEIIEVRGAEGAPPYVVRFDDSHERLVFPGPDCTVQPAMG
jgi:hypothetical protein